MSTTFWRTEGALGGPEDSPRRRSRSGESSENSDPIDVGRESIDGELALPPAGLPRRRGQRLVREPGPKRVMFSPEQRLLILDTWQRSGLPALDFSPICGVSAHSLYQWKKRFQAEGPAGLASERRRKVRETGIPEITRRTILMLKDSHPEWGSQRISDALARGPAIGASANTVSKVLRDEGYELEELSVPVHEEPVRRFERGAPNELWQTDLFTFVLKRQNRRVYLVAFLDDNSRFVVSYGLHASQSAALVLEVFRSGIASYGAPKEVLTDNGSQYVTWRGKSAFAKECAKLGVEHIVARPRHPQTLGKTERFWGTLWRECVEAAIFLDLEDARKRIGHFIDHYNFQRPHQGIDGLVPADRFFHAAPEVLDNLKKRVLANSLDIARHGVPKEPFYLTGSVGGQGFSVHAEGERVYLRSQDGERREIDIVRPTRPMSEPLAIDGSPPFGDIADDGEVLPGQSPLDSQVSPFGATEGRDE